MREQLTPTPQLLRELAEFARCSLHTNGDNADVDAQVAAIGIALELFATRLESAGDARYVVVAWECRYLDPEEGPGMWCGLHAKDLELMRSKSDWEVRPLYAALRASAGGEK